MVYLRLRRHVLSAVVLEQLPFRRVMVREVPAPPAVPRSRRAGDAEVPDQLLPDPHLPFVLREPHGPPCCVQRCRKAAIEGMHHGAVPLACRAVEEPVQAVYLKGRIMGHFFHGRVAQRPDDVPWDPFPRGAVYYAHRSAIDGIREQQYLEVRGLHVSVQPRLLYVHAGVRLQVYVQGLHIPITPPGPMGRPVIGSIIGPCWLPWGGWYPP